MSAAPAPAAPVPVGHRRERSGLLPGWAASLCLHAALLFFAATQLQSCTGANSDGEATEGFREVGIRLRPSEGTAESPNAAASPAPAEQNAARPTADPLSTADAADALDDPAPLEPAEPAVATLGPGPGAGGGPAAPTGGAFDAPTGPVADPGSLGGAAKRGVTEFFGIRAAAESFVYVVDKSGSMDAAAEFAVAKREVLASLDTLGPRQKFQVLFFNGGLAPMEERGRKEGGFYLATNFNKTLARQFVGAQTPGGGTEPLAALEAALELEPDAIFFLTDGKRTLSPGDFSALRRLNRGDARIHCVRFGHGPDTIRDNAINRLASEHGGGYQYRDVRTLR